MTYPSDFSSTSVNHCGWNGLHRGRYNGTLKVRDLLNLKKTKINKQKPEEK